MKVNISAPVAVEYDQDGYFSDLKNDNFDAANYLQQRGNTGIAFDFGAVYKITPKITVSGSIVDLGKISFKKDVTSINQVSTYKWEGVDFSNSVDDSKANYVDPSDLFDNELDKMKASFKPKKSDVGTEAFNVTIPTKMYLGGTYQVTKKFDIGLLDRLYKNGAISENTVTLSANAMLGNFFSLTGSYSMIDQSYNNLGLGMGLRLGFMQLYFVSDNLMALANPAKAQFVNARFGMNFLFGRKKSTATE